VNGKAQKKVVRAWIVNFLGAVGAVLVAEICLSFFSSEKGRIPVPVADALPAIANFSEETNKVVKVKQFSEGFGVAHFNSDGSRSTGNDLINDAPTGLIIGDSFVEALQVDDRDTMGAVIERTSRSELWPVNVRQFGWGGTSSATYLAIANSVKKRWNPRWVSVLFNEDDFTEEAISGGRFWKMEIDPIDSTLRTIPVERTGSRFDSVLSKVGLTSGDLRELLNHSNLAYLAVEKYLLSGNAGGAESSKPTAADKLQTLNKAKTIAKAVIRGLKVAYGEELLIVYVPQISVTSSLEPDTTESILAEVCYQEKVQFISARRALLGLRERRGVLGEGFSNTLPGYGHLNELGHQAVGQEIWRAVSERGRNNQ
jgi:hypothetical protein